MKRIDCIRKRTKNSRRGSVRAVWLLAAALAVVGLGIILQSHQTAAAVPLPEWSNDTRDVTTGGREFLGRFSNQTVSLLLSGLPAHDQVTVSFDLFIIGGGWRGNLEPTIWDLRVAGGPTLLHTTFSNDYYFTQAYPDTFPGGDYFATEGASEVETLGYVSYCGDTGDCAGDSVYHLSFSFPHSISPLQLDFSTTGLGSGGGSSWGLDNVEVAVGGNVVYSNDFENGTQNVFVAYVTNLQSDVVSVIETQTNTLVDAIALGTVPNRGVAITPDGTRAYVANEGSVTVTELDLRTNKVQGTVEVGLHPREVAITPDGTRAYVTNLEGASVSVLDLGTSTVIATIPVGQSPNEGIAVTPDGTRVYVSNGQSESLSVIDTSTNSVTDTISVGPIPRGMAITPDGTRVYVSIFEADVVAVIDTATNAVVASIAVGGRPNGVAVTPDGSRVYVANQVSDNVTVIDTQTNAVIAEVFTGVSARVAITQDGAQALVTNWESGMVSVIDTQTNTVVATVEVGGTPNSVAIAATPLKDATNDDFDNATVIGSLPFSDLVNTAVATTASDDPYMCANSRSVWYSFTPTPGATRERHGRRVKTRQKWAVEANTFNSNYAAEVSVWTGSRGALSQVACGGNQVVFNATAGTTYYLMVAGENGGLLRFKVRQGYDVDLTVNPNGELKRVDGKVTISGTVRCSEASSVDLSGELRQRAGRFTVIHGAFSQSIPCSPPSTLWRATIVGENGPFGAGPAKANIVTSGCGTANCDSDNVVKTVRLKPRPKSKK